MKTLYIDGLCEPQNPAGVAAIGFLVEETGYQHGEIIGYGPGTTNNVAEYRAGLKGLEYLVSQGEPEVLVRSDSKLLVQQANGIYAVNAPTIRPLYEQLQQLRSRFHKANFAWIPGKENQADELCWKAYLEFMDAHPEIVRQYQWAMASPQLVEQLKRKGLDRRYIGRFHAEKLLAQKNGLAR